MEKLAMTYVVYKLVQVSASRRRPKRNLSAPMLAAQAGVLSSAYSERSRVPSRQSLEGNSGGRISPKTNDTKQQKSGPNACVHPDTKQISASSMTVYKKSSGECEEDNYDDERLGDRRFISSNDGFRSRASSAGVRSVSSTGFRSRTTSDQQRSSRRSSRENSYVETSLPVPTKAQLELRCAALSEVIRDEDGTAMETSPSTARVIKQEAEQRRGSGTNSHRTSPDHATNSRRPSSNYYTQPAFISTGQYLQPSSHAPKRWSLSSWRRKKHAQRLNSPPNEGETRRKRGGGGGERRASKWLLNFFGISDDEENNERQGQADRRISKTYGAQKSMAEVDGQDQNRSGHSSEQLRRTEKFGRIRKWSLSPRTSNDGSPITPKGSSSTISSRRMTHIEPRSTHHSHHRLSDFSEEDERNTAQNFTASSSSTAYSNSATSRQQQHRYVENSDDEQHPRSPEQQSRTSREHTKFREKQTSSTAKSSQQQAGRKWRKLSPKPSGDLDEDNPRQHDADDRQKAKQQKPPRKWSKLSPRSSSSSKKQQQLADEDLDQEPLKQQQHHSSSSRYQKQKYHEDDDIDEECRQKSQEKQVPSHHRMTEERRRSKCVNYDDRVETIPDKPQKQRKESKIFRKLSKLSPRPSRNDRDSPEAEHEKHSSPRKWSKWSRRSSRNEAVASDSSPKQSPRRESSAARKQAQPEPEETRETSSRYRLPSEDGCGTAAFPDDEDRSPSYEEFREADDSKTQRRWTTLSSRLSRDKDKKTYPVDSKNKAFLHPPTKSMTEAPRRKWSSRLTPKHSKDLDDNAKERQRKAAESEKPRRKWSRSKQSAVQMSVEEATTPIRGSGSRQQIGNDFSSQGGAASHRHSSKQQGYSEEADDNNSPIHGKDNSNSGFGRKMLSPRASKSSWRNDQHEDYDDEAEAEAMSQSKSTSSRRVMKLSPRSSGRSSSARHDPTEEELSDCEARFRSSRASSKLSAVSADVDEMETVEIQRDDESNHSSCSKATMRSKQGKLSKNASIQREEESVSSNRSEKRRTRSPKDKDEAVVTVDNFSGGSGGGGNKEPAKRKWSPFNKIDSSTVTSMVTSGSQNRVKLPETVLNSVDSPKQETRPNKWGISLVQRKESRGSDVSFQTVQSSRRSTVWSMRSNFSSRKESSDSVATTGSRRWSISPSNRGRTPSGESEDDNNQNREQDRESEPSSREHKRFAERAEKIKVFRKNSQLISAARKEVSRMDSRSEVLRVASRTPSTGYRHEAAGSRMSSGSPEQQQYGYDNNRRVSHSASPCTRRSVTAAATDEQSNDRSHHERGSALDSKLLASKLRRLSNQWGRRGSHVSASDEILEEEEEAEKAPETQNESLTAEVLPKRSVERVSSTASSTGSIVSGRFTERSRQAFSRNSLHRMSQRRKMEKQNVDYEMPSGGGEGKDDTIGMLLQVSGSFRRKKNKNLSVAPPPPGASATAKISPSGEMNPMELEAEVLITLAYSSRSGHLSANVIRGRSFPPDIDLCEIHATLTFDGVHSVEKGSDPVAKPGEEPHFNKPFSFALQPKFCNVASLVIQFWGQNSKMGTFEIGDVEFGACGQPTGIWHWAKMQQRTGLPFPMWHKLLPPCTDYD